MIEDRSLAGRIREYLTELEQVVERAVRFAGAAEQTGEEAYWDADKSFQAASRRRG
jgi:hypothetical protein